MKVNQKELEKKVVDLINLLSQENTKKRDKKMISCVLSIELINDITEEVSQNLFN